MQEKIVRWRQPKNVHLRDVSRRDMGRAGREVTLGWFRQHGPLAGELTA